VISLTIVQPDYPPPAFPMAPREVPITALIFHHSDGSPTQSPLDIDQEHRGEGWAMIGYDLVIPLDGSFVAGRPEGVIPSAALGMNYDSIDVCILGDFQPGTDGFEASVPAAQLRAAKEIALYYHQKYPTISQTIGHRDVAVELSCPNDATACPGQVFEDCLGEIRNFVASRLGK
jgi:N-acetylmuramoyl-L-alanine amidase